MHTKANSENKLEITESSMCIDNHMHQVFDLHSLDDIQLRGKPEFVIFYEAISHHDCILNCWIKGHLYCLILA